MIHCSEALYILGRIIKAYASYFIYLLFAVFNPVKKGKIVFSAFEGGGYSCNCKYIAEGIIGDLERREKYDMYWLVNDADKHFPVGIRPIKNTLINRAYHLSTAEIWIDNARKNLGTRKRRGQLYIQTWHGQIGVKPVGRKRGELFSKIAEIVTRYDAKIEDVFLVNSKYARDIFTASFYNEKLVKTGSPRCDILVNDRKKQYKEARKKLGIPSESLFFIYAPTFRGGSQKINRSVKVGDISMNFEKVRGAFEQRFGGEWFGVLRLHPQLAVRHISVKSENNILDISLEDDLYEYLVGADAFISDYSSAQADAAIMEIPVFTYADDIEDYTMDRGKLLCDLREFPYPVAYSNEELVNNIISFDKEKYIRRIRAFFKEIELLEDGKATKRVLEMIDKHSEVNTQKN